jgi:hypothetical protein
VLRKIFGYKREDVTGERRKLHNNNFRLPPPCKWDLHSSGMLRRANLYFVTDVSGQPIFPTFKSQAIQDRLIISDINILVTKNFSFSQTKDDKMGRACGT